MPNSPNLPVSIDTSYPDSATDPSVQTHQIHHDILHGIANAAYKSAVGTTRTTAFTLTQSNSGEFIPVNAGTSVAVTVPSLEVGTTVELWAQGAGKFTLTGFGVTLQAADGITTPRVQFSSVGLLWVTTTLVFVSGDLG